MKILAALTLALLPLAATAGEVPDILYNGAGDPIWIAAGHALDEQKKLRLDVLGRFAEQGMRYEQKAREYAAKKPVADGECPVAFGHVPERWGREPHFIITGRVAAVAEGLFSGGPGSLILLDEVVYEKGEAVRETYLYVQFARIRTAETMICGSPGANFTMPRVGDRVIVRPKFDPLAFADWRIIDPDRRELEIQPQ